MVDHSLFDKDGKLKPVNWPLKKSVKDWWVKGFQLNRCYLEHWDEIKEAFEHYEVDLNRQGPIMTMQTLKYVRLARQLTEKIKDDETIREMASHCSFPVRTVYYANSDRDKIIDGIIFVTLLRLIPQLCLDLGLSRVSSVVENGESKKYFKDIFSMEGGTILETEKGIENIARRMVQELINGKNKNK